MAKIIRLVFFMIFAFGSFLNAEPLEKLSKKLAKGILSSERKKVAVLVFPYHNGYLSDGSSIVSERLTTYMVKRKISVIERRLIQKILEEKKLNETGIIETTTAKRIGSVLGVDAIVTGTLIDLERTQTEVVARVIDTETGEILSAGTTRIDRIWSGRPRPATSKKETSLKTKTPSFKSGNTGESFLSDDKEAVINEEPTLLKQRRLSNESFPPGRRIYHSPETYKPKEEIQNQKEYQADYNPNEHNNDGSPSYGNKVNAPRLESETPEEEDKSYRSDIIKSRLKKAQKNIKNHYNP